MKGRAIIQVPYPTGEHGLVVPPNEIELPESENPEYTSNHHLYWEYNRMGRSVITSMFRDLAHNQLVMPVDQHCALHRIYSPPKTLPSLSTMVEQIELAKLIGEPLKQQHQRRGRYVLSQISSEQYKNCLREYDNR